MVWLENKRDTLGKEAVYPSLSGPMQTPLKFIQTADEVEPKRFVVNQ